MQLSVNNARLGPHCGSVVRSIEPSPIRACRVNCCAGPRLASVVQRSPLANVGWLSSSPVVEDVEDAFVCHGLATKKERRQRRQEIEAAKEPEAMAILRFVRGSPNKMRRVIDTIRGRSYEEALVLLEYLPYRATEPILKTLLSAAANAKHNLGMKKTKLYVSTCYVDEAPVFKRARCRARGRSSQILKRNSHITIKVKERDTEEAADSEVETKETEMVQKTEQEQE